MRKYGVFNTITGITERVDTLDQATDAIASVVAEVVMLMKSRCPITVIDIAEDGTETWRNADGVEVPNAEAQAKAVAAIRSKYDWVD